MNGQDPLAQLRDIHLPDTGGFWPPAPGWWLLALLSLTALALAVLWWRRRLRRNRWLKCASRELAELERSATPEPAWFAQVNALLKQAARQRYPERFPEALSGDAWVDFLLATAPRERIASRPIAEAMVEASWRPSVSADPADVVRFSRLWLRGQKC